MLALFSLIWRITKLVLKLVWKVLRILLFRWGFIFVAVYVLGAFIINIICGIGLSPGGQMRVWYYIGLVLSVICTAVVFILNGTKADRGKENKRQH